MPNRSTGLNRMWNGSYVLRLVEFFDDVLVNYETLEINVTKCRKLERGKRPRLSLVMFTEYLSGSTVRNTYLPRTTAVKYL